MSILKVNTIQHANGTEAMTIDSSGNLTAPNNLTITGTTTNTGAITSTGGIYLGGTASANLLDDYEEGSWTPTIVGATSGSATIGAINLAKYIKIGKQVTIWMDLQSISKNTLSGIARISLPFASSASGGYPTGTIRYNGLANMSTSTVVDALVSPGTSYMFLQSKNATGYVITDLTDSNFSSTFAFYMINLTYQVS